MNLGKQALAFFGVGPPCSHHFGMGFFGSEMQPSSEGTVFKLFNYCFGALSFYDEPGQHGFNQWVTAPRTFSVPNINWFTAFVSRMFVAGEMDRTKTCKFPRFFYKGATGREQSNACTSSISASVNSNRAVTINGSSKPSRYWFGIGINHPIRSVSFCVR